MANHLNVIFVSILSITLFSYNVIAADRVEYPSCVCGEALPNVADTANISYVAKNCMGTVVTSNLVLVSYSCYMKLGRQKREADPYTPINAERIGKSDLVLLTIDTDFIALSRYGPICFSTLDQYEKFDFVGQNGYYYFHRPEVGGRKDTVQRGIIASAKDCINEMDYLRSPAIKDTDLCLRTTGPLAQENGGPLFVQDKNGVNLLAGVATHFRKTPSVSGINYIFFNNIKDYVTAIEAQAVKEKSKWCPSRKVELKAKLPSVQPPWPWTTLTRPIQRDESLDCECGIRNEGQIGRVVGGEAAEALEFPWIAQLHLPLFDDPKGSGGCGGALINDRMILTAAHCVIKIHDEYPENNTKKLATETVKKANVILLHSHKRWTREDYKEDSSIKLKMKLALPHPQYFESIIEDKKNQQKNIALILLDKPLDLTKPGPSGAKLRPICVPKMGHRIEPIGKLATAAGWGHTVFGKDNSFAKVLQKVDIPIVPMNVCSSYQQFVSYNLVTDNYLCAGNPQEHRHTYRGDTGGPLIVEDNNRWYQVGVTSYGAHPVRIDPSNPRGEIIHLQFSTDVQKLIRFIDYHSKQFGAKWCKPAT